MSIESSTRRCAQHNMKPENFAEHDQTVRRVRTGRKEHSTRTVRGTELADTKYQVYSTVGVERFWV